MGLSAAIGKLFPEEFVIDERPVAVLPSATVNHPLPAVKAGSALSPGDLYFNPGRRQDLLTQLSALLVEQVVLADRARRLEQRAPADDEFGRFVRGALPFLDNFARLLDLAREKPPSGELDAWLRSVEALYFRIVKLLEDYGLRFVNSLGKGVDLDLHEVVEYRKTDAYPHNVVIKEVQKGVVFRGHPIRDARVVVACNDQAN